MIPEILLALHIAVLGYWLGSELVINSSYRFICFRDDLPFAARDAMTDHLMDVDQHVRYALILQLVLGAMLMQPMGLAPGMTFVMAPVLGVVWILLVELAHRNRKSALGQRLAILDRGLRYGMFLGLIGTAATASLPFWLAAKLVAFAGIIGCGVAIRFWLMRHFRVWGEMARDGASDAGNKIIKQTYWRATGTLILLWTFIAAITMFAVLKPQ